MFGARARFLYTSTIDERDGATGIGESKSEKRRPCNLRYSSQVEVRDIQ
jgi:hypothetical protein